MQTYAPLSDSLFPLPDARLGRRLDLMIDQFDTQPNATIPQATEDRNHMDAAYAFFDNDRVSPGGIVQSCLTEVHRHLEGHRRLLCISDTSDFNFSSLHATSGLGYTAGSSVSGLLLHSTLAVLPNGLPIGLLTQQIWTRDPAQKGQAESRRGRPTEDKESYRWRDHAQAARASVPAGITVVHVADREGDIYDWFAAPRPADTHLLVRVAQANRIVVVTATGKKDKLANAVAAEAPLGTNVLELPRADDQPSRKATMTIRVAGVQMQRPRHAKPRETPAQVPVWVIEAKEEAPPAGQKAVCWRLVTTERVATLEEALRALAEYVIRWRIERFHYVLKQGFLVEQLQLETAARLANAIAVYSQVAVRQLRLTYLARVAPETPVGQEFTAEEVDVLNGCREKQEKKAGVKVRTIAEAIRVIGRLGGHLGRKGDGLPGAKTLWRGLRRLYDRILGYRMAQKQSNHSYEDVRNE